jgi:hypothetical protein
MLQTPTSWLRRSLGGPDGASIEIEDREVCAGDFKVLGGRCGEGRDGLRIGL